MRLMSSLTRVGLLFLAVILVMTVSDSEIWESESDDSQLETSALADSILGTWGVPLLALGVLMAMAMIGAAYLVRDERRENLEYELGGGDLE